MLMGVFLASLFFAFRVSLESAFGFELPIELGGVTGFGKVMGTSECGFVDGRAILFARDDEEGGMGDDINELVLFCCILLVLVVFTLALLLLVAGALGKDGLMWLTLFPWLLVL